ncbi:afadin- and alpha-actinin-binding protein-like [Heptranchias perlo]|uniref:afadin- and alpha-actinin-binding protein-like n=1 Tax=Heptranchias perlo TaxID=212740 RepID=UPI00355ABF6C
MGDWRAMSVVEAGPSPDAKNFILRCVSQSASPFSTDRTVILHCSPVLSLTGLFNQSAFCWGDNVEECLSYLNKELTALGLPSLYGDDSFEDSPASSFNLVALINSVYSLLQLHQKTVAKVDGLETERFKSFNEQDSLKSSQLKLQEQVVAFEREFAALQAKEQQGQKNIRNLNNLLKNNKDEVVKLQNIIASRAAQYVHDLKRKEQELNKLKEKMHHHLTDKRDKRIAIDILNHIGRSDGRRSLWRTGKTESRREGEVYKVLAGNYEAQIKELVLDNTELRRVLNQMKREISGFLSPHKKLCRANSLQSLTEEEISLNESQDVARGHLTDSIQKQWNSLKDHMEKLGVVAVQKSPIVGEGEHVVSVTDHDKEIAKLKLEVEQSKEIISVQQQLLEEQLTVRNEELARGSDLLEEQEWFYKERQLFEEQKKNFKVEREKFTEAAIRLGQERKSFEEECALHVKEQFLNLTPFRDHRTKPKWKLRSPFAAASPDHEYTSPHLSSRKMGMLSMRSHCAPMHTPSPPSKGRDPRRLSLPTTHELYKVLGLIPEQSFRSATTARLKRSCSTRGTLSNQRDSATQTRNDLGWIRTALFTNDPDDSLYSGHLCTPI